jgi:hypothetical protein
MSEPYQPDILYPNGGETIASTEVTVRWSAPNPEGGDSREVSYELYYDPDYDATDEPDWRQIAVVPGTATQFVWRFGTSLRSSRVRIALRARNSRGERSDFAVSAGDFAIRRRKLAAPAVMSPHDGERIDRYIQIITNDTAILGSHSQRSFYQMYYSSEKAGVASTSIAQNVPLGSVPTLWNTADLPPSDDYVLQVFLSDDEGNRSDSTFIRNLQVVHEGFFLIDTTPPVGAITINSDSTFTRTRDVSVGIYSYDETTGVQSMQLLDSDNQSSPLAQTDAAHYQLSDGDEIKTVQLLLQDFGGNRNNDLLQRIFETSIELENTEIADIAIDRTDNTLWAVTSGATNYLYRYTDFPAAVISLPSTPTAVEVMDSVVYIGVLNGSKGTLLSYGGIDIGTIEEFTGTDSVINSMAVHGDDLFIGMESGQVYSFDGEDFDIVVEFSNPVRTLTSDGNLLYLVLKNDSKIYIYNGTTFFDSGA